MRLAWAAQAGRLTKFGGREQDRLKETCNTRSVMPFPLVCACQDSPKGVAWDGWARSTGRGFPVLVLPLHICGGGVCSTYLLCRWQPPLRIGGCAITDQAHSPFLRRGLNEVTTYESEAAKHCTPMVLGVGVQFVVQSVQSEALRHQPSRSCSGSIIGVQRPVYRWCRPGVRGAFVIGVHGRLGHILSQVYILLNTCVRERFAIFALTKSQISFEDRHDAFHSLGELGSTWDTEVHFDT